jgi:hypothetical protein
MKKLVGDSPAGVRESSAGIYFSTISLFVFPFDLGSGGKRFLSGSTCPLSRLNRTMVVVDNRYKMLSILTRGEGRRFLESWHIT